jgi:hypothetical protein
VDVKLEGCQQDVIQGLWVALTSQKHVQAGLWKGDGPLNFQDGSKDSGDSRVVLQGTLERGEVFLQKGLKAKAFLLPRRYNSKRPHTENQGAKRILQEPPTNEAHSPGHKSANQ